MRVPQTKRNNRHNVHHHRGHWSAIVVARLALAAAAVLLIVAVPPRSVAAEDLSVSADVPAPMPTQPSVITSPVDGAQTTSAAMTISGSCEMIAPPTSVVLYSNSQLLGSTACNSGSFSLPVTLFVGVNHLLARTITVTNDYGPDSAVIDVTYTVPPPVVTPPSPTPTPASTPSPSPSPTSPPAAPDDTEAPNAETPEVIPETPFKVEAQTPVITFGPHLTAKWVGALSGGTQPYNLTINWGDGAVDVHKNITSEVHTFEHKYTTMKAYSVTFEVTDAKGAHTQWQFAATTPFTPSASVVQTIEQKTAAIQQYMKPVIVGSALSATALVGVLILVHMHVFASGAAGVASGMSSGSGASSASSASNSSSNNSKSQKSRAKPKKRPTTRAKGRVK